MVANYLSYPRHNTHRLIKGMNSSFLSFKTSLDIISSRKLSLMVVPHTPLPIPSIRKESTLLHSSSYFSASIIITTSAR